ncbi:hypothetical protein ACFQZK_23840 [Rhodococcus aetherivorans]
MRLQPRTKKTIAILVIVALVAIGGLTAVVVSSSVPHRRACPR